MFDFILISLTAGMVAVVSNTFIYAVAGVKCSPAHMGLAGEGIQK